MKLPYYLHDKWRNNVYEIKGRKEIVKFKHFVDFVRKEAKKATDPVYGREVLSSKAPARQANDKRPVNVNGRTRKSFVTTVEESNKVSRGDKNKTDETANNEKCMICEGSHLLDSCSGMSKWTLKDRYSFLKSKGLCFGCLRAGHTKRSCQSKIKCKVCDRYHPSILHVDPHPKVTNATARTIASATHSHKGAGDDVQALPIVAVRVKHESSDKYVETYAFLDSGSTATFCSDRLADRLNVQGRKAQINLLTMGNERTQNTRVIKGLEASSLNGEDTVCLGTVFTQPSLPVSKKDIIAPEVIQQWPHLKNLPLSRIESDVDLLIGVNVPRAMEPWEVIPSLNEGPFAVKTALGWVVNGPLSLPSKDRNTTDSYTHNCFRIDCVQIDSVPSLDQQIRNQFDYDFCERTIDDKLEYSVEDKKFIEMVNESIVLDNGHYTIDLPFRSGSLSMINNRSQAEQRLRLLAKRMKQDPSFGEEYRKFMCNVIEKGYAEAVPPETLQRTDGQVWYLPHHGVFHPKKKKIRVVFDCAAKFQGMSLNDELLQGPNLTNTLIGTLTRFRQDEVVFMGDIESMFYQVHVPEKDRDFQRFLWFEDGNPENKAIEYRMTVHLFGSKSSPSCANFALRQCALQCQGHFNEEVINTVLKNFYVDDCLKSTRTVDRAKSLVQDLKTLLNHGGFSISKWISNSKEVMNSIPATERAKGAVSLDFDQDSLPIERALGMDWCAETDKFTFTLNLKDNKVTRRGILSMVSSVFDPLGFLAPMLLKAKLLLQELCKMNLGWDTPIPEPYANRWIQLLCDIQRITEFKVDRCFKPPGFDEVKTTELHHFADASESGYGVVSYLRTVNIKNEVHCSFVMGKSRVSPLKKVTVPRLELTAATVAVRTDKMLKSELEISVDRSFFWTDSMSVLRYIRNTTSRFHTFVANRLNVIHEGSSADDWHYINTKMNPADLASRGLIVDDTLWSERWIKAPKFLWEMEANQIENPPEEAFEMVENDPEVKRVKLNCAAINIVEHETDSEGIHKLILKHSSWLSLKRSVAWILKIRKELLRRAHCRKTNENANAKFDDKRQIMVEDLVEAEKAILMVIQKDAFPEEICSLRQEQPKLKRGSHIKQLDPVMSEGLLRVGGRLHESALPAESKHPVILPKNSHVSMLVLREIHLDLKHSGRNHMLSRLREKYWLVNAPSAIRKLISKCVVCRRQRSKVGEQKMSHLPEDRVRPDEPPFTRVGVDYFGPIEVKLKRSRVKRYDAIFTCLACRAVHIEIAFSLDTSSYINCLRRFIARRGQVLTIRSDNGTNFKGAERELKQSIDEWNVDKIQHNMIQRNIDWKFNPPAGSHHGGVWERLIRSIRCAMNSTLKEQVLDDEGLLTLMCEIEAVLNDRPITKVSNQCNDLEALTPNHLLLMKRVANLPPGIFGKSDNYGRRRWRQVQYMANLFWQRWLKEYLPLLQERQKWLQIRRNLTPGDVVLIVDSSAPRNSWPMGVVVETKQDKFGLVRQASFRTATNVLNRPIDKLCLILETD